MPGRLESRLLLPALALALITGGVVMVGDARRDETLVRAHHDREAALAAEAIARSLTNAMLAGEDATAHDLGAELERARGLRDFQIVRLDGVEAFRDNRERLRVRDRQRERLLQALSSAAASPLAPTGRRSAEAMDLPGETTLAETAATGSIASAIATAPSYPMRPRQPPVHVLSPRDPALRSMVRRRQRVSVPLPGPGDVRVTLSPIVNQRKCHNCHDAGRKLLGAIRLKTNATALRDGLRAARKERWATMWAGMATMWVLLWALLRWTVTAPLRTLRDEVRGSDEGADAGPEEGGALGGLATEVRASLASATRLREALEREGAKLKEVILRASEGLVVADRGGRVTLVNGAAAALLGKSVERVVQDGFEMLFDDPEQMRAWLASGSLDPHTVHLDARVLAVSVVSLCGAGEGMPGAAATIRDVTELHRLDARLQRISRIDGLTTLYNRRALGEILPRELVRARRYDHPLALITLCVDGIDATGEGDRTAGEGDGGGPGAPGRPRDRAALQAVARVLSFVLRAADIACRLEYNRFCAVLPCTDLKGALALGERLRAQVKSARDNGDPLSVSVGVTAVGGEHDDAESLLGRAEVALLGVSGAGGDGVQSTPPPRRGGAGEADGGG